MANIWSVSAFPPNCKVEFGDDLEENKAATFIVKLKDFQKKGPFKDGGLDVTDMKIIIKDPKGSETECARKMKKGALTSWRSP